MNKAPKIFLKLIGTIIGTIIGLIVSIICLIGMIIDFFAKKIKRYFTKYYKKEIIEKSVDYIKEKADEIINKDDSPIGGTVEDYTYFPKKR